MIAENYLDSSLDQSADDRFDEVREAGRTVTLGSRPSLKPKKKAKRKRIKLEETKGGQMGRSVRSTSESKFLLFFTYQHFLIISDVAGFGLSASVFTGKQSNFGGLEPVEEDY